MAEQKQHNTKAAATTPTTAIAWYLKTNGECSPLSDVTCFVDAVDKNDRPLVVDDVEPFGKTCRYLLPMNPYYWLILHGDNDLPDAYKSSSLPINYALQAFAPRSRWKGDAYVVRLALEPTIEEQLDLSTTWSWSYDAAPHLKHVVLDKHSSVQS